MSLFLFFFMVNRRFPPLLSLITNGCNDICRLLSGQIFIKAYKLLLLDLNSGRKGVYDFIIYKVMKYRKILIKYNAYFK